MPIETTYEEEGHVRCHRLTGILDADDIMTELKKVFSSGEFPVHANVVWDLSKADVSGVTRDEMRRFASVVQSARRDETGYRAVFIVGSDLNFGLARMYEQLQSVFDQDAIRVFRSTDHAWRWVKGEEI